MKRGPWLLAVAMLQPGILCMAGMQKTSEADTRLQAEAHRMDLSACPAVMRGPGCQQAKALPKCINGVFRGPLTLSKNGFHNDSHAAEYGVTDPAHFAALPPQDFMGSLRVSIWSQRPVMHGSSSSGRHRGGPSALLKYGMDGRADTSAGDGNHICASPDGMFPRIGPPESAGGVDPKPSSL